MSYKLEKPYTQQQKNDFVAEYYLNKHLIKQETEQALYALERDEMLLNGEVVINPNYEEEQAEKERERISMLFLTAADVERGLYKALGKDFDDIIEEIQTLKQCKANQNEETLKQVQGDNNSHSELVSESIDIKALKIELKANNFYRGNPYVSQMGALLGLTEKQLDEFFETNDYTKLVIQEG